MRTKLNKTVRALSDKLSKRTKYILGAVAAFVIVACSTTGLYSLSLEGNLAVTGTTTLTGATTQTGDLTLNGGAGAITLSGSGDSSIVVKDADTTALVIGADGALDILGIDSSDAAPKVDITGINGQTALHVNVGNLVCDEASTFTGDAAFNGGAGAITLSGSGDSSIVLADADSTALVIGATGALDILGIDTTDANPKVDITGINGQTALHVNVGNLVCDEASTFTGDASFNGGAGALTLSGSGDSSIVLADADSTALVVGATGALNILGIDTTDASPSVDITGVVGQVSAHVDAGTLLCDELAAFGAGANMDGDVTFGGGAGAVTFDAADASIVYTDASATGLVMGSSGHLNLITLDSTDNQETLIVTGETAVDAFSVAVGTSDFVENVDMNAGADITGALTVSTTSDLNGDIAAGGGAGALTFDAANSSIVCTDNSATGLDIGSDGALDMMRFSTLNGAESIEFRSPAVFSAIYETFGEGANKGLSTMTLTGTAAAGSAGVVQHAYTGMGNIFGYAGIDDQADDIDMTATGLNIGADQADDQGREIWTGYAGASGRPFVVGTDPAFYFLTGITIGDIDGTDTLFCGFKKLEVHNADYTAYDTYFGIGATTSADPMVLRVIEELNGAAGAATDTTDTLQDATVLQIKILVDASGVATAMIDADTPGTLEAPDTTSAFTFDDGDLLVPICTYKEHAAGGQADTVEITHWEVGLQ